MVVVDDVRAERLVEKSSGGAEVTTEDRPGHVKRRAQIMRKETSTPRLYFGVGASSSKVVFIRSAEQFVWSLLKESRLLRWVWALKTPGHVITRAQAYKGLLHFPFGLIFWDKKNR
jgi:hypothetical protein